MFDRYKVVKKIASGATGTVLLARGPDGSPVAIKTLTADAQSRKKPDTTTMNRRFMQTAKLLSKLRHPNIVRVYDCGEADGLAYVVMEYIAGYDVSYYLRGEAGLSLKESFRIVTRAAKGVAYAHRQGVIHRDIKPANIVYERQSGAVKVTDFGLSKTLATSWRPSTVIAGTPYYMAPEQVAGGPIDARADVYALGVTLFHLITGVVPFRADSMEALIHKIEHEEPPDILALRSDLGTVGVCLRAILDNVLQKRPQDRYQNCDEFIEDLVPCADVIVNSLT